ncbi:MAG: hypothetical protein GXP53_12010 [Deltaproteobacteria bacterium]|nr:hypothetical protein [Deltaproteobacteria bacterium]
MNKPPNKPPVNPMDLSKIRTYSLAGRKSKVCASDFGRPWKAGGRFDEFLDRLPAILGAADLRRVIDAIISAKKNKKPVIFAMGAHVIKVGLSPLIIDLMEKGIITAVVLNGAGIIHDFEIAFAGRTSEDVSAVLHGGDFGMAKETGEHLGCAISMAGEKNLGLGEAVGRYMTETSLPHLDDSIIARAFCLGVPVTVHVAMGTDIIHMHPGFDPAAAGAASHKDFRILASIVAGLSGGVFINAGSAVILPEVFLKAVSLAINLGHDISDITCVNLDFIRHYRPMTNVVGRPAQHGGIGISLVGHHEIMIPLIAAGVIEKLAS